MSVYVFTGPTLSAEAAAAELDAIFLPPVAQGDVYRVAQMKPQAIGIIDGYFERVPAVWHKEILWAIERGIPVFGSSSMGALRAAELAPYGMIGVGDIFEAYRDGVIEDDDEVAVAHASAADGYQSMSEPMVNIRITLRCAEHSRVISEATRAALEQIAKESFYPERDYATLIQRGKKQGLPADELTALEAWLPSGRIDQKQRDAVAMLRAMAAYLSVQTKAESTPFSFEHTVFFDRLMNSAGELAAGSQDNKETISGEAMLDEVLLDGSLYTRAHQGALARYLGVTEARRRDYVMDEEMLDEAVAEFRQFHGLSDDAALERWLNANHLDREQFRAIVGEEATVRRLVIYRIGWDVRRRMTDQLRLFGEYERVATRARHKRELLEAYAMQNPSLEDVGLTFDELLDWHAEYTKRLACTHVQGQIALARYARSDPEGFTRTLLREFCYLTIQEQQRGE